MSTKHATLFFQLMVQADLLCQQIRPTGGSESRDSDEEVYTHLA